MPYPFPPDVQQLIASQMASGCYASEDDLLRDALHVLQQVDEDAAAILAAVDEWKHGDEGLLLDQAFDQVRESTGRKPTE